MAYIRDTNNPDAQLGVTEQPLSATPTITTSSGAADTSLPAGQGAQAPVGGTTTTTNPNAQTGSGNFTNLQKYLNANTGPGLGNATSGYLDQQQTQAANAVGTQTQDFANQVNAATNIFNPDVIDQAVANPTSALTNADVQKQISGSYTGPYTYAGTAQDTAAQAAIKAGTDLSAQAGDIGGRTNLINQAFAAGVPAATGENQANTAPIATPSVGGQNLNQFLLQNNPSAYNQLQNAAGNMTNFATNYGNVAGNMMDRAASGLLTNLDTKKQALARLQQGRLGLEQSITDLMAGKQQEANTTDYLAPIRAALAGGNNLSTLDPTLLSQLGINQGTIDQINAAAAEASKYGGGVNLADYLTAGAAPVIGTADAATAQQKADLAALEQMLGYSDNFLQAGTKGGTGAFNSQAALNNLRNQTAAGLAAQQARDKAAADAAYRAQLSQLATIGNQWSPSPATGPTPINPGTPAPTTSAPTATKAPPPPTWMDTYNAWAPQYQQQYGAVINRPWSTDADSAWQKEALDAQYKANLEKYNAENNTNVAPDASVLGVNAQPNNYVPTPSSGGGFWSKALPIIGLVANFVAPGVLPYILAGP